MTSVQEHAALSRAEAAAPEMMRAVTLRLEDELFAIEATRVREILDLTPVTRVPNASAFAGALINVRGAVVPLADFRVMFGMDRRGSDQDTRIVVIEVELDGEAMIVGLRADKVHDVTDIAMGSVEIAPKVGMRWPAGLIRGIGQHGGEFIVIPDLDRIFATYGGAGPVPDEGRT
jgi:purine-binding chemotaxis protein CheW